MVNLNNSQADKPKQNPPSIIFTDANGVSRLPEKATSTELSAEEMRAWASIIPTFGRPQI